MREAWDLGSRDIVHAECSLVILTFRIMLCRVEKACFRLNYYYYYKKKLAAEATKNSEYAEFSK